MPSPLKAALDLGSNTFRLLLAQSDEFGQGPTQRQVWQRLPRIAEGLEPGGVFQAEPLKRAWADLNYFQEIIVERAPARILAGATMAFRLAADGPALLSQLEKNFGWRVVLLSGRQEASLAAQGVLSGLSPIPPEGLIFDIGGRSTEFIRTQGRTLGALESLPLGVVSLTAQHIHHDPPTPEEIQSLKATIAQGLEPLRAALGAMGPDLTLVGTAGTVTTVAAMLLGLTDYDSDLVNNRVFEKATIEELFERLASLSLTRRQLTPGLHPRRADVILAGLLEVLGVMSFFEASRLVVSDNSLLEGLWLVANDRARIE
ncbi:MAG: hypothetical protein LBR11_06230 [Deltaproteobacteria bacterium]|jgi:exopolyphosphatase/guanosine-5'-triphosphate,3'-diphosphate pyrophosphatase|nr:hypothetical protein [Deltaproteobacteria bacterium]